MLHTTIFNIISIFNETLFPLPQLNEETQQQQHEIVQQRPSVCSKIIHYNYDVYKYYSNFHFDVISLGYFALNSLLIAI